MEFDSQTGICRCGRLVIEVSAPPLMTAACHCRGCQRMSSSAFSLTAIFPAAAFHVVAGTPVKGGAQGPELDHYFCPDCKTWMFTRIVGMDDIVNVRPTMFDRPDWCDPFIETMTSARLPWASTPARHSYAAFPEMADFPALLQEFANERGTQDPST
ncbi:GFA family protein [Tabrizicola sp. J26]|uniref:GFA family protein n=1 Tax=Alitabrizicola rongguiensis TaxID=2909234 RepID=UPI001F289FD9|nr:GFA family protein [Tabrizicola rongguiensis]MCF1710542.1 GFA family protein [Tabrizicola rongguiensis]